MRAVGLMNIAIVAVLAAMITVGSGVVLARNVHIPTIGGPGPVPTPPTYKYNKDSNVAGTNLISAKGTMTSKSSMYQAFINQGKTKVICPVHPENCYCDPWGGNGRAHWNSSMNWMVGSVRFLVDKTAVLLPGKYRVIVIYQMIPLCGKWIQYWPLIARTDNPSVDANFTSANTAGWRSGWISIPKNDATLRVQRMTIDMKTPGSIGFYMVFYDAGNNTPDVGVTGEIIAIPVRK